MDNLKQDYLLAAESKPSGRKKLLKLRLDSKYRKATIAVFAMLCVILAWGAKNGQAEWKKEPIAQASGQIETKKITVSAPSISSNFSIDLIDTKETGANSEASALSSWNSVKTNDLIAVGEPIGTVKKIYAQEGERVSKGQKLMVLDDAILALKVQRSQAKVDEAQASRVVLDEKEDELKDGLREINKTISKIQDGINQIKQKEQELENAVEVLKRMQGQQTEAQNIPANASLQILPVDVAAPQSLEELQKAIEQLKTERGRLGSQLSKIKKQKNKLTSTLDSFGNNRELADVAVRIAEIDLDRSKRDLKKTVVIASASGVVSKQNAQEGEVIFTNQSLLVITDNTKVTLTLYLPQDQAESVKKGQKATVTIDSYSNRVFTSTVTGVADIVEFAPTNLSTDRTHLAHTQWISLEVSNTHGIFKDGMPADAKINR